MTIHRVFVGDSITEWWQKEAEWQETFAADSLNLGVAGDRTEDVLYRLQDRRSGGAGQMDDPDLQPQVILVMIGTNHLWDTSVADILSGQLAVIARLRDLRPQARLIVQSVLPTGDLAINRSKVEPVNMQLADAVAHMASAQFLDLYPAFLSEDGRARRDLVPDGVHLSSAGYRLWRDVLMPTLGPQPL